MKREYGQYTTSKFASLTYPSDTSCSITETKECDIVDDATIKEYFTKNPVPKFQSTNKIPVVKALPNDWYDPTEDEVWEEYL